MLTKYIKFCVVGGIGALITFGVTWLFTEKVGLWYMGSLVIATLIAMTSNFFLNNYWTFSTKIRTPNDADYEWFAFYNGNPIQKWWKQSIAKTIWNWIPNSSTLLDIGCGSSPIIGKYKKAIGIDKNESKLNFMREKFPESTFINAYNTSIFSDEHFDYVLCIEVLEHLKDPERTIMEISRIAKVNGRIVIATPDYSSWLWKIAELFTPYKEEHVYKFTKEKLEDMCQKYNLTPIDYKYIASCDLVEEFRKIR